MPTKRAKKHPVQAVAAPAALRRAPAWLAPAAIALCVLIFYWTPLTSPAASIQWDAADMHYPGQKYVSARLFSGHLPVWTPYVFSGYPLLSHPEVAAWYVPHWPLQIFGVTPRTIQLELAVHALLACLGAWLLIWRLVGKRSAAVLGGFAYGLSGFFAGHSSHVGLFSSAAWLPWLLLCLHRAMASARWIGLGGVAGGLMLLAGYPQASLYGFAALALFAAAEVIRAPARWKRAAVALAGITVLAIGIGAIQLLPSSQFIAQSVRANLDFSKSTEGVLVPGALATLVSPNHYGAVSGDYTGPFDRTQFYFYAGLLLVPLALAGLADRRVRWPALLLILPAGWYMFGPAAGLYRLGALVPLFHKVRAPVQGWFVVALGLALLAAAGAAWAAERWRVRYLLPALAAVLFCDVFYWNSWSNTLAYARASYAELYGANELFLRDRVLASLPPLTRIDGPRLLTAFGPVAHPLDLEAEATYGFFIELQSYGDYLSALAGNPKLREGLNASAYIDLKTGRVETNRHPLARANFPKAVIDVHSAEESRACLESLDPGEAALILAPHAPIRQDAAATASVVYHDERSYRVRYRAASPSLLRLAVAWYPGWRASLGGRDRKIERVDHALMGVIVPPGEGEVEFRFGSQYLATGAALTLAALAAAAAVALWRRQQ